MSRGFKLRAPFKPAGDQPEAIERLVRFIETGARFSTLLGVTGSGKTFVMANCIARLNRPTIVISHNKTLAAQLYGEFKQFFPENAVEYFISYYDYYQPEAYVPEHDLYIEKDASINEEIERLRLRATSSLIERRDVIIVASVSCIYNLGEPWEFKEALFPIELNRELSREDLLEHLVKLQYTRNDFELKRSTFRVRGDVVEIHPSHRDYGVRCEFDGDRVARLSIFDILTGDLIERRERVVIYPARHFVTGEQRVERALKSIEEELHQRVVELEAQGKLLEAQRLKTRTKFDLEMIKEFGYCPGIENYSRHFLGKPPGARPYCLLDYFPADYLMFIDESHVTVPQIKGMFNGDRARKQVLVDYGFRLPSCLDNRPLRFDEFEQLINQVVFTSATPGDYELTISQNRVAELIVRPTGLVDPKLTVKPTQNQIDDLINEIRIRVGRQERVLVTTLTKRMAEDLADYLTEMGIRVRYLHSEIEPIERVDILRRLRLGEFDVLIGINLLREGLDLPEVSLVAVLDADKEGFLRDARSLIQTAGRAARNVRGEVILYADNLTRSIRNALAETERRRQKQIEFNNLHGIVPRSIEKTAAEVRETTAVADAKQETEPLEDEKWLAAEGKNPLELLAQLEKEMTSAAQALEFEKAAKLRDRIRELRQKIEDEEWKKARRKRLKRR
ncbi:MAG: excinuclease ABC subunit UvrB [candidate division WOR-3 bacterium]|jgi:excinuclease ABC subunit B|nr:excinuclease ABC subunit UvrB [candidate division WOR-3 bacterium]MCR4423827.1 excinuclease ABC subunit UvrB [candidate division WOR-3 bacterium]MDH7519166.1 excinuclease ABC subunit UvrB [bacterium]